MKITAIRSRPAGQDSAVSLLEVECDQGVVGLGPCHIECIGMAGEIGDRVLLGEDPRAVVAHWSELSALMADGRIPGADMRAAAALDVALWDLKAKLEGQPLWRSLGGSRPRSLACIAGVGEAAGPDRIEREFASLASAHGLTAGMIEIGRDPGTEIARVEAMREGLGRLRSGAAILLKVREPISRSEATALIRAIEEHQDVFGIEVALDTWGRDGLRKLSEQILAAVSASSLAGGAQGLFATDGHPGFDMLTIDPAVSGVSGSLQIAEAAYGYEIPVMLAPSFANNAIHMTSAMPNLVCIQIDARALDADTDWNVAQVEDGCAVSGNEPGNGLSSILEGLDRR